MNDLVKFIEGDEKPIIAFYGGEPLLNPKFIVEVMERLPRAKYVIQTNGVLINNLEEKIWRRFNTVLLSIDGRRRITDYYRGTGIYDKVLEAAKYLKNIGFSGDLIARMTVSEESDIHLEVKHLLDLNLFDHIHWQLDVIWSDRWLNFERWCKEKYIPNLKKLILKWMENAERGKVLGLVPFIGILKHILRDSRIGSPPCGAGRDSISILTDGRVIACPIAVDVDWARLGDIWRNKWYEMRDRIHIGEPCKNCKYFRLCGGRCLYTYKERLWGDEGFRKICKLSIELFDSLIKLKERILYLIGSRILSWSDFDYPKFNNTTEIIP